MFDPVGDLIGWVEDQIDMVNRRVNRVYSYVEDRVRGAVDWVADIAGDALWFAERAWNKVQEVSSNLNRMINDAIDSVIGGFYWVLEAGAVFFQVTLPELWDVVYQTLENLESLGEWVIEYVSTAIEDLIEDITRIIEQITEKLTVVWETMFEGNAFWKWFERMLVVIW